MYPVLFGKHIQIELRNILELKSIVLCLNAEFLFFLEHKTCAQPLLISDFNLILAGFLFHLRRRRQESELSVDLY
jgi:hypothetical protein